MQSKTFTHYLGLDVSKKTIDACLFDGQQVLNQCQCNNTSADLRRMISKLLNAYGLGPEHLLICAEYTGMYIYPLTEACTGMELALWLQHPAELKHSNGVQRGKNDVTDARRIAYYAHRFADKVRLYIPCEPSIKQLQYLDMERELMVTDRAKYMAQLKDQKDFMPVEIYKAKSKRFKRLIKQLDKAILELEQNMDKLIKQDTTLTKQYEQVTSIDGVGKQVAIQMLITTKGFTTFTNARKFCCHAGVAPFAYLSGTSQRSRWRVSHRANKRLKWLFHMAALSAIRIPGELQAYFLRKVAEGKNKMTVINAIRAKLIHRIFAVIKNNTIYEKNYLKISLEKP